jgi:hypothetical protein
MTTLADIARNHGVTPQAVGKWRDLALAKYGNLPYEQVGKRKQYIPDAVAKILEFAPSRPTRPGCQTRMATPEPSAVQVPVEIYDGNEPTPLDIPELPASVDLEQFRREGSVGIDLSTAQIAIALTRQLGNAMEADLLQQWQQLQATQKTAKDLEKATQTLDRQAMAYRIESSILAKLQANESNRCKPCWPKCKPWERGRPPRNPTTGLSDRDRHPHIDPAATPLHPETS